MSTHTPLAIHAGRIGRGIAATLALGALSVIGFFLLTYSCCSTPDLSERIGHPVFWLLLLAMPVPIAAFPPVSSRLRGQKLRWLLVPSVLICLGVPMTAVTFLISSGEPDMILYCIALGGSTLLCALYVAKRVILSPGQARETPPVETAR